MLIRTKQYIIPKHTSTKLTPRQVSLGKRIKDTFTKFIRQMKKNKSEVFTKRAG